MNRRFPLCPSSCFHSLGIPCATALSRIVPSERLVCSPPLSIALVSCSRTEGACDAGIGAALGGDELACGVTCVGLDPPPNSFFKKLILWIPHFVISLLHRFSKPFTFNYQNFHHGLFKTGFGLLALSLSPCSSFLTIFSASDFSLFGGTDASFGLAGA